MAEDLPAQGCLGIACEQCVGICGMRQLFDFIVGRMEERGVGGPQVAVEVA